VRILQIFLISEERKARHLLDFKKKGKNEFYFKQTDVVTESLELQNSRLIE
jgi:hypothetical protein